MYIQIGSPNWRNDLINETRHLGDRFWDNCTPVDNDQIIKLERQINRKLPDEFKEFYRLIGCGYLSSGDSFFSPNDILACLGAPIYFVLGSLSPKKEWATKSQHQELWLSRGKKNPSPDKFTEEILTLNGVKLYDLLQFGANGSCCYHQLYVGSEPAPFYYCLLTDSGTIENVAFSFSEAMNKMIENFS